MKIPFLIGLTGGIGSGKSMISKVFETLGVPVYDADTRAKWLSDNHPVIKSCVLSLFGNDAYSQKGLNRQFIAKQAFGNPQKLDQLNKIVHPKVAEDFQKWLEQHQNSRYILKEAALLFESGSYKELDKIIAVYAPEEMRIRRVLQRDPQRSIEEVKNIINRQLPEKEKLEKANWVISNDETTFVIDQVLKIHHAV